MPVSTPTTALTDRRRTATPPAPAPPARPPAGFRGRAVGRGGLDVPRDEWMRPVGRLPAVPPTAPHPHGQRDQRSRWRSRPGCDGSWLSTPPRGRPPPPRRVGRPGQPHRADRSGPPVTVTGPPPRSSRRPGPPARRPPRRGRHWPPPAIRPGPARPRSRARPGPPHRPPAPWETLPRRRRPAARPRSAPDPGPPAPPADHPAASHDRRPRPRSAPRLRARPRPAAAPAVADRRRLPARRRGRRRRGGAGPRRAPPPGRPLRAARHRRPHRRPDPTAEPTREPTAEQEALWAFTRRHRAAGGERVPGGRPVRPAPRPARLGDRAGTAPPPPPPPVSPGPPGRVPGRSWPAWWSQPVALFVLVVLRWPDRGASDGPAGRPRRGPSPGPSWPTASCRSPPGWRTWPRCWSSGA